MLDDLREQADGSAFEENEFADLEGFESFDEDFDDYDEGSGSGRRGRGLDLSFGMTPAQRAMLSILLLGSVLVLSALCLLVTGRLAF